VKHRRVSTENLPTLPGLVGLVEATDGFDAILEALGGGRAASIDGAWGSSAALATSALAHHAPGPMVVVVAHPRDIDGWLDDLRSFGVAQPEVFAALENRPADQMPVDETARQRLRLLVAGAAGELPAATITTMQALVQPVPEPGQLVGTRRALTVGNRIGPEELGSWLYEHGFHRNEAIELPGDFSRRGGIVDIFPTEAAAPIRVEFFGDEIESIRGFDLETQRSLQGLDRVLILPADIDHRSAARWRPGEKKSVEDDRAPSTGGSPRGNFLDYLPKSAWIVLVEPQELTEQGTNYLERAADAGGLFSVAGVFQQTAAFANCTISALPAATMEALCHMRVESVERFSGAVGKLRDELDGVAVRDRVFIACHNEAEKTRLGEVLASGQVAQAGRLHLVIGQVHRGFRLLPAPGESANGAPPTEFGTVVLSDHELFHREDVRQIAPRRRIESRAIDSFLDLSEGELVVHVSHGIARYRGMRVIEKNGRAEEHLVLEFRDEVLVYVPISKINLVQKYVGGTRTDPELSSYGGTGWARKKERVEAAVMDLASDMVALQAVREAQAGVPFPADSEWQAEFEAAFPYAETPDQLTTSAEIKRDLERSRPMDRLVCGDVGYGKTELAMRAAFKVVDNGKQVAVLVPTTVLAEQHFRTFRQRMAEYPFVVDGISRFRSAAEQRDIVGRLAQGGIDIIIGTHRLVSADVQFKDLGLVIIDEEQRFGVEHKERLKKLRQMVDVLTLTATPIPRTLHLALLGIRDISNLETPPADRLAIETRIARFDPQFIRYAILRELDREGQVYFVHNRVYNIRDIANKLQSIVPEARLTIAHGQMPEHELEDAMLRFVRRDADVLVATTIIESGLDIPNVNTIFINQADNYGLADLHQLRGRVGRYRHRAYAYLLLDSEQGVTPTAARRLKAIEEFTELGAGFKIALRDLEIRGAGNILGTQQSGHIAAVGYELYCQLLESAVARVKQQPKKTAPDITLDLPWPAFLPREYVPGQRLRIEVYRRLARIRRVERLMDFQEELRDRFGLLPENAEWLLRFAEIRLLAARWQISAIHLEPPLAEDNKPVDLVLTYRQERKMRQLAARSGGRLRIIDGSSAYYRLETHERKPLPLFACLKELLRLLG
jgi:transcription-repair coupling factor (superfamily II helicase)